MKIVSFNVNGIRARLHQLKEVIEKHSPDIIGLQETKVDDSEFPVQSIYNFGYNVAYYGQKGHYGVALLFKKNLSFETAKGFKENYEEQKRIIRGKLFKNNKEINIINCYFPQGESREHPVKFPMKKKFYADLKNLIETEYFNKNIILMGDFNVAPEDFDVGIGDKNAKRWLKNGKCCFLPEEREWFKNLKALDFIDTFRYLHPNVSDKYSWFDYRSKGFNAEPKRGLRIDLILSRFKDYVIPIKSDIDYEIRRMEKPSDHCPVWTEFII
jgi:exodeoxyribonuclease-3